MYTPKVFFKFLYFYKTSVVDNSGGLSQGSSLWQGCSVISTRITIHTSLYILLLSWYYSALSTAMNELCLLVWQYSVGQIICSICCCGHVNAFNCHSNASEIIVYGKYSMCFSLKTALFLGNQLIIKIRWSFIAVMMHKGSLEMLMLGWCLRRISGYQLFRCLALFRGTKPSRGRVISVSVWCISLPGAVTPRLILRSSYLHSPHLHFPVTNMCVLYVRSTWHEVSLSQPLYPPCLLKYRNTTKNKFLE